MISNLGINVFDKLITFITDVLAKAISMEYLLFISMGLFLLFFVIAIAKTSNAYEVRALKSIDRLNTYFLTNPYINQDNIVDFNKRMKTVPTTIRYQWQQYVLNRDKLPSFYMSRDNCIEKPLKTSDYHQSIKLIKGVTIILASLAFVIGLAINYKVPDFDGIGSVNAYYIAAVLLRSMVIPAVLTLCATLYIMFLRSRINIITGDLYRIFYDFERNIDKATTTLPEYIDYEVLFTEREIKQGIPILQEYLDKKARQEQEEIKRAMEREIEYEKYNFDSTGIDGSLLLERAMKESELFIVNRKRILSEIEQLQTEAENSQKNFDTATKEINRKLQATKENLARFKVQQEQSTNRIETNYIRKQQADEVKKQQQLEHDLEEILAKNEENKTTINNEVEIRKQEIEENRKYIEEAMLSEFKTFSEKAYQQIYDDIDVKLENKLELIRQDTQDKEQKIEELENMVAEKAKIEENLEGLKEEIKTLQKEKEQDEKLYDDLLARFNSTAIQKSVLSNTLSKEELDELKVDIVDELKKLASNKEAGTKQVAVKKNAPVKKEESEQKQTEQKQPEQVEKPKVQEKVVEKQATENKVETKEPVIKKTRTRKATPKTEVAESAEDSEEKKEELKKKRADARKAKREEEAKRKADELAKLQQRIKEENLKLAKQQTELKKVIDNTIDVINASEEKKPALKLKDKEESAQETPETVSEETKEDAKEESGAENSKLFDVLNSMKNANKK